MKYFLLAVLSVWLIVGSACESQASAPTSVPTPSPTIDPSWARFTAFDKTYSFAHPSDWTFEVVPGQTILFDLPDSAGFAVVLLDSPLSPDRVALGQSLQKRLSDQAARGGDQFKLIVDGRWPQTMDNYFVEHLTVEPLQQVSTYHVTFLIASPQQQTLFVQYFHLGATELSAAERQMLLGILGSLQFAPR